MHVSCSSNTCCYDASSPPSMSCTSVSCATAGFSAIYTKLVRVQTIFMELTICHAVNGELKLLLGTELKVALV